jgi:hypothetical protein
MFKKVSSLVAVALIVAIAPIANGAEELVTKFEGKDSTITASFSVNGPWLLDWRVNSDYTRSMAIDIVLLDAETGLQVGRVKHKKEPDNGLRLFDQGGRYKIRIDASHTRWQVKIIQITKADAELYTPK